MLIANLAEGVDLRLLETRHAAEYHRLVSANMDRLYWLPAPYSPLDASGRIRAGLNRLAEGSGFDAGIFDRGALCGFVGLFHIEFGQQSGEIGYWLDRAAEGRGLATRGCQAAIRYGFEDLGLHRIELRCGAKNARSIAVARRLGFRLEGSLRQADRAGDGWDDFLVYGLLADEWRGAQTGAQRPAIEVAPDAPEATLREVTQEDYERVIRLRPRPEQAHFVAPNVNSLAESKYYPGLKPMSIYAGDTVVGFTMWGGTSEDPQYWIVRLMIDAQHQGHGYGRAAMHTLIALMREQPGCHEIRISYEPENVAADRLYASLGFERTGEILEGEVVACLSL